MGVQDWALKLYTLIYVPVEQFWIIVLLGQYSLAYYIFFGTALFSNTVNTLVENEDL